MSHALDVRSQIVALAAHNNLMSLDKVLTMVKSAQSIGYAAACCRCGSISDYLIKQMEVIKP